MKVTQNPTPNSAGLDKAKATDKAGTLRAPETQLGVSKVPTGGDSPVTISDQAYLMKQARDIASASPDFGADKVSDLKKRIKDGSYKVDAAAVAERLLDEHLASNFGKNDL
jgi:negative regulator of flagellin synthesis FlgM